MSIARSRSISIYSLQISKFTIETKINPHTYQIVLGTSSNKQIIVQIPMLYSIANEFLYSTSAQAFLNRRWTIVERF